MLRKNICVECINRYRTVIARGPSSSHPWGEGDEGLWENCSRVLCGKSPKHDEHGQSLRNIKAEPPHWCRMRLEQVLAGQGDTEW